MELCVRVTVSRRWWQLPTFQTRPLTPGPSKHETLIQCCFNVGPAGPKLKQHWINVLCLLGEKCQWSSLHSTEDTSVHSQKAVSADFISEQILPFGCAEHCCIVTGGAVVVPSWWEGFREGWWCMVGEVTSPCMVKFVAKSPPTSRYFCCSSSRDLRGRTSVGRSSLPLVDVWPGIGCVVASL